VLPEDDAALLRQVGIRAPADAQEGLFASGCWLRRVSAEPVLLFGGGRALLLEVAHPLVAAGVAEHSDFERDPFGRLQRTLDAMSAIVFRARADALATARAVEAAHLRVRGRLRCDAGPFRAGTPYSGRDPELVRWVWATLVDTALLVYERFVAPLDAAALAAYYADQRGVARLLGVPEALLPETPAAFRRYVDRMLSGDVLTVTEQGRAVAAAVLDPAVRVPGQRRVADLTAALLPPRLREAFGLDWDEERARRVEGLVASVRALRAEGAGRRDLDAPRGPR
jgi:uncharacterized protein (DUF2236 family)